MGLGCEFKDTCSRKNKVSAGSVGFDAGRECVGRNVEVGEEPAPQ